MIDASMLTSPQLACPGHRWVAVYTNPTQFCRRCGVLRGLVTPGGTTSEYCKREFDHLHAVAGRAHGAYATWLMDVDFLRPPSRRSLVFRTHRDGDALWVTRLDGELCVHVGNALHDGESHALEADLDRKQVAALVDALSAWLEEY